MWHLILFDSPEICIVENTNPVKVNCFFQHADSPPFSCPGNAVQVERGTAEETSVADFRTEVVS